MDDRAVRNSVAAAHGRKGGITSVQDACRLGAGWEDSVLRQRASWADDAGATTACRCRL